MTSPDDSDPKTDDSDRRKAALTDMQALWPEYQYRHELCWRVSFQLTAAAVVLGVAPHTAPDVTSHVGHWIVLVPLVGIALTVFGFSMIARELELLDNVRSRYRDAQKSALGIDPGRTAFDFSTRAKLYLGVLLLLQILNLGVLSCVFCPHESAAPAPPPAKSASRAWRPPSYSQPRLRK